jgi:putative membrane protein
MEYFNYFKALHIIFVVCWFAGLFYIVRLFIYQVEANQKTETEKSILIPQFQLMQKRLWYGITWPAAILTMVFGFIMFYLQWEMYMQQVWMVVKLVFVGVLFLYHLRCQQILNQLKTNSYKGTSLRLRLFNEVATLLLFAIVFLVSLKSTGGLVWGMLWLIVLAGVIMGAVFIYRKQREKNKEK